MQILQTGRSARVVLPTSGLRPGAGLCVQQLLAMPYSGTSRGVNKRTVGAHTLCVSWHPELHRLNPAGRCGEHGEQRKVSAALPGAAGGPFPSEGEHSPELVTVEPGGLAVIGHLGPAHAGDGDRSIRSSSVAWR